MGKIVALVPARAGSTRVKNKNIRQIAGMPLIGIAVKQALDVKEIDEVYVSTDSELYAEIAQTYGAVKPFLRPAEIAGNQSTDYEVFRHFLDWYMERNHEKPDMIVQVRATAPARDSETIGRAVRFMREHTEFDSLRSVSVPHQTPYKMWKMRDNMELVPVMSGEGQFYDMPTQDLPKCYGQDGIVDIVRPDTLLNEQNMAGKKIAGFLDHPETWDIDTEQDLIKAGAMLRDRGIEKLPDRVSGLGGNLGIIQGRLTESEQLQCFPKDWKNELPIARKAGYAALECFRDKNYNAENPLWNSDVRMAEMKELFFAEGVGVRSVCDDYVQECEWRDLKLEQYLLLEEILIRTAALGANIVVFPMFEKADLNISGNRESFIKYLTRLSIVAEKISVRIALEISEPKEWLCELFDQIPCKNVGLCVDTGNLNAAGIDAVDIIGCRELRERLFHVHLKDRNSAKENVIPGSGNVNFSAFLKKLYEIRYQGLLVTETARGDHPVKTAEKNKEYFAKLIGQI